MGGGLTGETLGPRALNRALLARQGLLERTAATVPELVARLCGLQAQVPSNPYVALWARIDGFRPEALSDLLEARALARAQTLRATIHLHTADDLRALQPLTGDVLARVFRGQFRRLLGDVAAEDVAAFGRSLLAGEPRSRAELTPDLKARWPGVDANALAQAVTFNNALVQATPRGLWGRSGGARWAPTEAWLGAPLDPEPSVDAWVLRYLAAFGPATSADVRDLVGLHRACAPCSTGCARGCARSATSTGASCSTSRTARCPTPARPRRRASCPSTTTSRSPTPTAPGSPRRPLRGSRGRRGPGSARSTSTAASAATGARRSAMRPRRSPSTASSPLRSDPGGTAAAIEAEGVALLALIAPGAEPRVVL